ncbi:hypothetical protein BD410DRAFT_90392 [Rickenella mellea]|uniref:Uncharacterized protein n=1 Tax=Rickenella mellea TaxID=50990 RepID=A0A4Y7QCB1_9AGAM|nr:hypothetical protein BD410DRAFT_90392 [Rickenella mellea]
MQMHGPAPSSFVLKIILKHPSYGTVGLSLSATPLYLLGTWRNILAMRPQSSAVDQLNGRSGVDFLHRGS